MPDLFSHLATSRVPAAFLRDRRLQALLVFGSFLPDMAAKTLYWVAWANSDYIEPFHSLTGLLVLSYIVALFFEEPMRKGAFAALYGGSLLHVGLDLVKDNLGTGSASLLYPFSTRGFELGWIDPENVIWLIPAAAVLLVLVHGLERRYRRVPQ